MSGYQRIIAELDPGVDARHVEGAMRLQYGTLCHLSREVFAAEIRLFKLCEAEKPGYGESCARSFGL
jgi:hypothetical protein